MDQRVCLILLPILAGCAGPPAVASGARVADAAPVVRLAEHHPDPVSALGERAAVSPKALPGAPVKYDDEAATAKIFVENTNRTIALYREFIDHAGTDPQYAAAVKRSREQIQDLNDTLKFVRSGIDEQTPAKPDEP